MKILNPLQSKPAEHTNGLRMSVENLLQFADGSGETMYHLQIRNVLKLKMLITTQTLQFLMQSEKILENTL